jgi:hypothetical protein
LHFCIIKRTKQIGKIHHRLKCSVRLLIILSYTTKNCQSCRKEYFGALYAIWRYNVKWRHYVIVRISFMYIEAMGKCDYNLYYLKCIMAGTSSQYYEEIFTTKSLSDLLVFKSWWGPFFSIMDFMLFCVEKRVNHVTFQKLVYIFAPISKKEHILGFRTKICVKLVLYSTCRVKKIINLTISRPCDRHFHIIIMSL